MNYRILQVGAALACLSGWGSLAAPSLAVLSNAAPTVAELRVAELRVESRLPLPQIPELRPLLPEVSSVRLVLKLRERRLHIYKGDQVTSYPVAVGKSGWETPVGQFQVLEMVRQPGWTNPFTQEVMPPGPDNPLGTRWIAFWTDGTNYVGFHGTPSRSSVGQAASHGCVRMFNEDVEKLYDLVRVGTSVTVEP